VKGLLEREGELAAIDGLLEAGSGVLVVEGASGIGKTALLEAARCRAEGHGFVVLRARGSELEAGFAFGVVRQLFERCLLDAGRVEQEALVSGPAAAVGSLFRGDVVGAGGDDRSFAVLHGLFWLAVNLAAERPVLIVVDDVHWADGPSLRWLGYLAPRLEGLPIVLIVALRLGGAVSPGAPLSRRCVRRPRSCVRDF
jgi:predicted ATPase